MINEFSSSVLDSYLAIYNPQKKSAKKKKKKSRIFYTDEQIAKFVPLFCGLLEDSAFGITIRSFAFAMMNK